MNYFDFDKEGIIMIPKNTFKQLQVEKQYEFTKGLHEAWECAKKLCQSEKYGGLEEHCSEIFGRNDTFDIFDYSPEEAIEAVKNYQNDNNYWISIPGSYIVKCSSCGCRNWTRSKFCPDCGSYMKREGVQ